MNQTNSILKDNKEFKIVELHSLFLNDEAVLDTTLSRDGIHINENGYEIWTNEIKGLVDSLNHEGY